MGGSQNKDFDLTELPAAKFDIEEFNRLCWKPVKGAAVAIIPARYSSARLPGKPLLPLAGIPMIVHVLRRASSASLVTRVLVATDDKRIADAVADYGGEAILTSGAARSGTDRVAEAAASIDAEIIVNVQGDEPLIDPGTIDGAIQPLIDAEADISTTSEPITSPEDVFNPNVVKVLTNADGQALYFSRSPIPYIRTDNGVSLMEALGSDACLVGNYRKHSGLYCYRRNVLMRLAKMEVSPLERLEGLEQLRALESGYRIKVVRVDHQSIGVDTEQDYHRVKKILEENIT
jgi:3-deoxy-manno-octulosonate cytidylyltransferase (CMP-KDO synthetase)